MSAELTKEQSLYLKPLVSILLPLYNCKDFVVEAVQSLEDQTYKNIEILILDDGSTDLTEREYEIMFSVFQNVRYIRLPHSGLAETLNYGIENCKGDFIARMDADDISLPNRIEIQINYLLQNRDIDIVSCSYKRFGVNSDNIIVNHPVNKSIIRLLLCYMSPVCHPGVMARKKIFNLFKYDGRYKAEDHYLWCQIASKFNIANVDKVLLLYRNTASSLSILNSRMITLNVFLNGLFYFFRNHNKIYTLTWNQLRLNQRIYKNLDFKLAFIYLLTAKLINLLKLIINHSMKIL